MRHSTTFLALLFASAATTACKQVECADGTIERDGECVAATQNTDPAKCGPFTELQGDQCVPMFPPTQCEDGTTTPEVDPDTGVTICKGEGGILPCGVPLACGAAVTGKLTICGQIYDFEDSSEFRMTTGADGTACNPASPTSSGPCALTVLAFDAIDFGSNPMAATPLKIGKLTIDTCGRFKLKDIDISPSTSPFIGLGFDDASGLGPTGVTVTVGIVTGKPQERVVSGVEGFILKTSTIGMWAPGFTTFGTTGAYAPIFRKHVAGNGDQFEPQSGVTVTKTQNPTPANDFYFSDTDPKERKAVDGAATATGTNGTALYTGAKVSDLTAYSGTGGLGNGCRWEQHAAASIPGLLFVQVFRKINAVSGTCAD